MIKVNLGSGFVGLEGWLNFDNSVLAHLSRWPGLIKLLVRFGALPAGYLSVKWPPLVLHDCRKGLPLESNSVDFIYTSHFLEHLYRYEMVDLLKECHRVLKPTGRMRVVLPDLDLLVEYYRKHSMDDFARWVPKDREVWTYADMFVVNFYAFEMGGMTKPPLMDRIREKFLRRHMWMYNAESFSGIMKHLHFKEIEKKAYRESSLPEVQQLDFHQENSFYIEAMADKTH